MYMGLVKSGSTVQVSLKCDSHNGGTALLSLSCASAAASNSVAATIAPGGSDKASLKADGTGWLRVWVDMNADSDTGQLVVSSDGTPVSSKPIVGDTTWTYTVGPV